MDLKFNIEDRLAYDRAQKKFKSVRSFYINLTCYSIVIPLLAAVNFMYSPEYIWFYWSAIGWGIGLLIHGISAFGNGFFSTEWQSQKIDQLIRSENFKAENIGEQPSVSGLTSDNVLFLRVQKRVEALGGFYKHCIIYFLVNIALLLVEYFDGDDFWSFGTWSTAIFWGMGLALHAIGLFTETVFMGTNWEQRKIAQIMKRQSNYNKHGN